MTELQFRNTHRNRRRGVGGFLLLILGLITFVQVHYWLLRRDPQVYESFTGNLEVIRPEMICRLPKTEELQKLGFSLVDTIKGDDRVVIYLLAGAEIGYLQQEDPFGRKHQHQFLRTKYRVALQDYVNGLRKPIVVSFI